MDEAQKTQLEAAAFRRLVSHLRSRTDVQNIDLMNLSDQCFEHRFCCVNGLRGRTDVQNIDLMNLSGFCRNCLSNWYQEAANDSGLEMDKAEAREIVYGMPYGEWKEKYQTEATAEQKAAFAANNSHE